MGKFKDSVRGLVMAGHIDLLIKILKLDPEYAIIKVASSSSVSAQEFKFGDYTLKRVGGMAFDCNGCGACCRSHDEGACDRLCENRCVEYESRPTVCRMYPFSVTGEYIEGAVRHRGSVVVENGATEFMLGLSEQLYLNVGCNCSGWLRGEKNLREIWNSVAESCKNFHAYGVLPEHLEKSGIKNFVSEQVAKLGKKIKQTPGRNIFSPGWNKDP